MQGAEDSQDTHRREIDHGVYEPVAVEATRIEDEDIYDPIVVEKRRVQSAFAVLEENKARQAFDDACTRAIRITRSGARRTRVRAACRTSGT